MAGWKSRNGVSQPVEQRTGRVLLSVSTWKPIENPAENFEGRIDNSIMTTTPGGDGTGREDVSRPDQARLHDRVKKHPAITPTRPCAQGHGLLRQCHRRTRAGRRCLTRHARPDGDAVLGSYGARGADHASAGR